MRNQLPFRTAEAAMRLAEIEFDVDEFINWEKNMPDPSSKIEDQWDNIQEKLYESVGPCFNIDPETRTRHDLIECIAHLEFMAGQLKDEIMDGQFEKDYDNVTAPK